MVDDKSCDNCAEETDNNGNCKPFLDGECVNINSGCPLAGRKWRERDFFKWLKGEATSDGALVHIIEVQSEVIKNQREEIAELKEKQSHYHYIEIGDFMIVESIDGFIIVNNSDSSHDKKVSVADVSKKLRELYFRTEENRSCDNCGINVTCCELPTERAINCRHNNYSKWVPF